jgi:hypothetical protein
VIAGHSEKAKLRGEPAIARITISRDTVSGIEVLA